MKEFDDGIDGSLPQDPATARPGVFLSDCFERLDVAVSFLEKLTRPLEWRTAASFSSAGLPHQNKSLELIRPDLH